ncbi:MAG: hydrogenase nickel incorporation protein HypB [Lachnospiraceae bacterium]|nr:hydrogenase nickel incorporation protein HypB [Lachnospiraceae bacterium]
MSDRAFEILETKERVIEDNDRVAAEVRKKLQEKGVFLVNLMASPGAGKTTTLCRTIRALKDRYKIGVMEADVDSDVDAQSVTEAGAKAIQLHTGGSCHMDADMTDRGLDGLGLDDLDIVFLENVGNLVCPAEFDVGANKRAVILSVPEGDDKPLKYPLMFTVGDVLLINKYDTKEIFDFDLDRLKKNVGELNPEMEIFPLSAKTGDGFDAWINWLVDAVEASKVAD